MSKRKINEAFEDLNSESETPSDNEQYIDYDSPIENNIFYESENEQAESSTYSTHNYQNDVTRQLREDNIRLKQESAYKDQVIFIEKQKKSKKKQKISIQKQEIIKQQQKLATQEQEIIKQQQKLAKKKRKISELKKKIVDIDLQVEKQIYNARKQEKKIAELNKAKIEKDKHSVTKPVILKSLTQAFNIKPSKKLLVSITKGEIDGDNKFEVLGRAEVKDNKQYRHITPHALLTKALENAFNSAENLKDLYENFSKIMSIFAKPKGICLKENEYQKLDFVEDIYSKKIITNKNIYYFIDNGKEYFVDLRKINTTREEATNLYQKKYEKYLIYHLAKLAKDINDDNSLTVTCELLARFIYTIFNKHSTVSFPDEGNTLNYEIRLYKNFKETKNCSNQYEILTVRELNEIINQSGTNKVSKKIRIVNNEGDIVKKSIAALVLLNDIIGKIENLKNYDNHLKQYNELFNRTLNSENSDLDLSKYNEKLDKKDFTALVIYHIAKQLYFLFDFKPLENKVFVMSDKDEGIKGFYGTSTKEISFFKLIDGKSFRDIEKHNYKGTIPCRSEVIDDELLAEKIITHTNIALLCFEFFNEAFEDISLSYSIIECFSGLLSLMYELKSNFFKDHIENRLNSKIHNDNLDNSFIDNVVYFGEKNIEYNLDIIGEP